MKNKLVFRILGALASALIIASVFIPFVSVTGYSQSLWETHSAVGTIYLPIMITVFGIIGVLVFSTGFKTELAYASAGGLLFFIIMQTVPVINQDLFNTLGVGYYSLAIGTLLIVIMAFICGLKVKQKVVEPVVVEEKKEESMIDQIDRLYNDQVVTPTVNDNNSLDNIIQPLPSNIPMSIPVENNTTLDIPVENTVDEDQDSTINTLSDFVEEIKPLPSFNNLEINETKEQPVDNLVMSEFSSSPTDTLSESEKTNPVLQQFESNVPEVNPPVTNVALELDKGNSVVSEFNNVEISDVTQSSKEMSQPNPVVSEFANSFASQSSFIPNNNEQTKETLAIEKINDINDDVIQPLNSDMKINPMSETTNSSSSDLDIFG